jgi:hypothetical protein
MYGNANQRGSHRGEMILSTHAIVGGALASLFPSYPIAAFALGVASHFAIDAIPHWDYPLQSISVAPGDCKRLKIDRRLLRDVALIGFDACAGVAIVVGLLATPATLMVIVLGALAAMLPDPLQFVHSLYPRQPLATLQRFHGWIHTKRRLDWPMGISSQIIVAAVVIGAALALRVGH